MISDLHIHTNHSDGSCSVGEVIDIAVSQGMQCIAVTDHDTVNGVGAALHYGQKVGLTVLPGIEYSAATTVPVHVLGYNFDFAAEELTAQLGDIILLRKQRASKILDKLAKYKVILDMESLPSINIGRSHIAHELVKKGYCTSIGEAFDRYLGTHRLAYVPDGRITPLKAVEMIDRLGGESVIAHPLALLRQGHLEMFIDGLKPYGLGGLEVYYPGYSENDIADLRAIADKYRLFVTGGSDFHGIYKSNSFNMLGKTTCKLPKELYR